ncbi:rhomboid family intramembrane serine protease [Acidothermaceae bacterium B102]|nr:rhomboid family intramembrane serine protease [Acidothermaceae bacterium B102]
MVIPVHDDNPVRRTPVITYALIVVNLVVFLFEPVHQYFMGSQTAADVCRQYAFFDKWAAIPKELLSGHPLAIHQYVVGTGASQFPCAPDYFAHKSPVLSVLFAMFLHAGWLHVLGNMLFLYIFGNNIEDRFGRVPFLVFYIGAGYAATYGFSLMDSGSHETLVGASGAIAGVLGAYLILYPRAKVLSLLPFLFFLPVRLPAWLVLGSWFVLQYVYAAGTGVGQGAGVAYVAHVVGFIVGMFVGYVVRVASEGRTSPVT